MRPSLVIGMKNLGGLVLCSLFVFTPFFVSAHEVYVLHPDEIATAVSQPSPNPLSVIPHEEKEFILWGVGVFFLILIVLRVSVFKTCERVFDPLLYRLKKYAPIVGRLTLGTSLLASGYFASLFGPELPLEHLFGIYAGLIQAIILIIGVMILFGYYTRTAAFVGLIIFLSVIGELRVYMLTYLNYLGEILLMIILGGGAFSIDSVLMKGAMHLKGWSLSLEKYSFFIMRVLFGFSLFFASFYSKFLHSNLALQTVADYHLTNYFHFTPLFLVLGAFIVEALVGFFIITGFEIRFAVLVFTVFLTMSILFFGEAVWPHIILFGGNIALFLHGYDEYTVEKFVFNRKGGEPVL